MSANKPFYDRILIHHHPIENDWFAEILDDKANPGYAVTYAILGQHSEASTGYIEESETPDGFELAESDEAKKLIKDLLAVGYNLSPFYTTLISTK